MEKDQEIEELKRNASTAASSNEGDVASEEMQQQLQQLSDEILHLKQDLDTQKEENEMKSQQNANLQDSLININSELKDSKEKYATLQQKCKQLIQQYKATSEQLNGSSQFTSIALRAAFEVGQYCIQQHMENTTNKSQSLNSKPKNSKVPAPINWMAQKRRTTTKPF